mmetsp:Transcript_28840/g.54867  ORF Transcript_28840/g.54867 Transcript_28840/m.54867 type:complete len:210 (-) Transcript_28840:4153-4782(-)
MQRGMDPHMPMAPPPIEYLFHISANRRQLFRCRGNERNFTVQCLHSGGNFSGMSIPLERTAISRLSTAGGIEQGRIQQNSAFRRVPNHNADRFFLIGVFQKQQFAHRPSPSPSPSALSISFESGGVGVMLAGVALDDTSAAGVFAAGASPRRASGLRSHKSRCAKGISIPSSTNLRAISWFKSLFTVSIQFTSRNIARTSKSSESAPNP